MVDLTGQSVRDVMTIITEDQLDSQGDQGVHVRLAMLARGDNPVDNAKVIAVLEMPAPEYLDYIGPYMEAVKRDAQATVEADGSVTVHLESVGDVTVKHLLGREMNVMFSDFQRIPRMAAMTQLTLEQIHALSLWEFAALEQAMSPFVSEVLMKVFGGSL